MASEASGLVDVRSSHSVDRTVERLKELLAANGATLFALIDHSGEAERAGLTLRPTKLLVFGSPRAGTPVMLASPSAAIDLPLKILVREDAGGQVWISYNAPEYLRTRHQIPDDLMPNLATAEALVRTVAA